MQIVVTFDEDREEGKVVSDYSEKGTRHTFQKLMKEEGRAGCFELFLLMVMPNLDTGKDDHYFRIYQKLFPDSRLPFKQAVYSNGKWRIKR